MLFLSALKELEFLRKIFEKYSKDWIPSTDIQEGSKYKISQKSVHR